MKVNTTKKHSGLRFLTVRAAPGNPCRGLIRAGNRTFPCALGRSGISAFKREGDGATPLAAMKLLSGYVRADRSMQRHAGVALRAIRADDGWCDAPAHGAYNRPVRLPFPASHEAMMRADRLYDHCLVLDWNIASRRRFRGSAIFLHVAKPGFPPTEGCIAVAPGVMRLLLPHLRRGTVVRVTRQGFRRGARRWSS
ncbi:L,D-transpeptidase [Zhengella sp. ZM62]|uniref:L,D-transpeptidase family protein n=1 Tax=Zhengella sedimenti TaxID=3390035 RepID=UPI003975EFB7